MDIIKKLDKTLKTALKTKHTRLISSIILICVIIASLKGSPKLFLILNNPGFKICISLVIIYISTKDLTSAIILLIVYIFILHSINKINVDTFIDGATLSTDIMNKVIGEDNETREYINSINTTMALGIPTIPIVKVSPIASTSINPTKIIPNRFSLTNNPKCKENDRYCWPNSISKCNPALGDHSAKTCVKQDGKLYRNGLEIVACLDDPNFFNTDDSSNASACYGSHKIYNKKFQSLNMETNSFVTVSPQT